ncbi:MAG: glycoside hydrolase family 127 protein [Draconibacterium sp.]|nr:glycoside hydrolase family 127 protein [Draconibacterium sp.]
MNETFADAYQITGDEKYLVAAKRFSHRMLLDAMAAGNDNLDNQHANTQVRKAVGFQRIAELSHDEEYAKAGSFFCGNPLPENARCFWRKQSPRIFPKCCFPSIL